MRRDRSQAPDAMQSALTLLEAVGPDEGDDQTVARGLLGLSTLVVMSRIDRRIRTLAAVIFGEPASRWHVKAVRYLGLVLGMTLICGCGPFSSGSTSTASRSTFPPPGAVIVLDDPLRDNSKGYQWTEGPNSPSGDCRFDKQAYQLVASSSVGDTLVACGPQVDTVRLDNLAFQASLTVNLGLSAGLQFRVSDDRLSRYEFTISPLGEYALTWFAPDTDQKTLGSGRSAAIKRGQGQTNLVGVVANGPALRCYVNGTLVVAVTDRTFGGVGGLGLVAYPQYNAVRGESDAVVAATNARAWRL
jgi:hypothetical protein